MVPVLLFVLLSAKFVATQQQFNISLGSSLTPTGNSSWLSPSGLYGFGFYQQRDGFAVGIFIAGIAQKTVVWTANCNNPPVPADVTLTLTRAGRFIRQSREGQETSIVTVSKPAAKASILDSRNFILYNSDEKIIWQSFVHPTDTLLPSQRLLARQQMVSSVSETNQSTGSFLLTMQKDGNLVQYPTDNPEGGKHAYWLSHAAGRDDKVSLNLAVDGHLYLRVFVALMSIVFKMIKKTGVNVFQDMQALKREAELQAVKTFSHQKVEIARMEISSTPLRQLPIFRGRIVNIPI